MAYLNVIIKTGGTCSLIGSGLLVLLAITLIVFPVQKICDPKSNSCEYVSHAPGLLKSLVNPRVLIISLFTIAGGVLVFRFGLWYQYRQLKRQGFQV